MGKRATIAAAVDDLLTSIEGKTILDRCQDNPALAIKVLKYLEQGIFDGPKAAPCLDFSRCVCVHASAALSQIRTPSLPMIRSWSRRPEWTEHRTSL